MKDLKEYILEQLNESGVCELYEKEHIAQYWLHRCEQEVIDKFDEIGMGFSSEEEEFDDIAIEMHYDTKEIYFISPTLNAYHVGTTEFCFNTKQDLITYHSAPKGLTINDLKIPSKLKKEFGQGVDVKIAEYICWFFNHFPEPTFKTAPAGAN